MFNLTSLGKSTIFHTEKYGICVHLGRTQGRAHSGPSAHARCMDAEEHAGALQPRELFKSRVEKGTGPWRMS